MILLTLNVRLEPTSECRPCGHMEAGAMALHRRGGIYHYHFWVDGTRYRGSTKKANLAAARRVLRRQGKVRQPRNLYAVLLKTDLIPSPWTCSLLLLRCPRLREENIRLPYALEGSVD